MAPEAPHNLDSKGRAARKAALTRSIQLRRNQAARWRLLVPDPYLTASIERLEREIEELQGQRQQLDGPSPDRARELGEQYLGFQRYER